MRTTAHTNIIQAIIAAHFVATAEQVERLAATVVEGQHADGTYLQVLCAHMQGRLGKTRRGRRAAGDIEATEHVLDEIHADLYASVMKGVGPADLDMTERNRRATFARSAASTVRYFIRGGGDVRAVDVATVTKAGLRRAVQPQGQEAPAGETRLERGFRRATEAIVRSAQRLLARGDPEQARQRIEAVMDELEALLEAEPEVAQQPAQQPGQQPAPDFGGTTTVVAGRAAARRGGAPAGAMLHRPAGT